MRLSVFGIESLDSLQLAVVNAFSTISPSPDVDDLDFGACGLLESKARTMPWIAETNWQCCSS